MSDSTTTFGAPLTAAEIRRRRKQEQMEEELLKEGGDENVTVCVRVRPFNRRELALQAQSGEGDIRSVIEMPEGVNGKVVCLEKDGAEYKVAEEFTFTKSFWSVSEEQQPYQFAPVSQFDMYDIIGKPIIKYAMFGFNNCVFAYGQTGSGKTFSTIGAYQTENGEFVGNPGIVPQLCKGLFERIYEERAMPDEGVEKTIDVSISAIEIYNEQVRDLFWRNTPGRTKNTVLKVRVHPTEGAFVDGLTFLEPKSWEHCLKLIDKGIQERTVAATLMNDESSRSHSVFQITVTQTETISFKPNPDADDEEMRFVKPLTHTKVSRINLVDLAGSERLKKSGAQGQQLKEAAGINQSLSTLKKVIDALVSNGKEPNPKKHVIVPFRESTLTLLLSHSLGGNSKTVMIACVSPHYDNQEETLLTLRYANRTKGIVNHAKVNEDSAGKSALALKHQILELQRKLQEGEGGEEAEDLRDQLEVGKKSLRDLEMANKRLEEKQAELIEKTQKEEGARFAAAFYNTVKMVLLQQEKENLIGRIEDVATRLTEEDAEKRRLREKLEEGTEPYLAQKGTMERMLREEAERRQEDSRVDELCRTLQKEYNAVKRKLDEEIGNRWGMRLVNYRHLEQLRKENDKKIEQLREDQENRLEDTILDAAEQYERQVKEYADRDTRARHRIAKIEQKLPEINGKREALEEESAAIHQKLRQAEKAHQFRLQEIEAKWRAKYAAMKAEGEGTVKAAEDAYHGARLKADAEIDRARTAAQGRQVADVEQLESDLRLLEGQQASKVAQEATRAAEAIALRAYEQEQALDRNMADTKEKFRQRISYLVKAVRATQAAAEEFEAAQARLTAQVTKFSNTHAKVLDWMANNNTNINNNNNNNNNQSNNNNNNNDINENNNQDEHWLKSLQTAWRTRGAQVVPILQQQAADQDISRNNNNNISNVMNISNNSYHPSVSRASTTTAAATAGTPSASVLKKTQANYCNNNNNALDVSASTIITTSPSPIATVDTKSSIGVTHIIQPQTLRSSTPLRAVAKAALTKNAVSPLRMRGDPLSIPDTTKPQYKERRSASPPPFSPGNATAGDRRHQRQQGQQAKLTQQQREQQQQQKNRAGTPSANGAGKLTPQKTRSIIQSDIRNSKKEKPMAGSMNYWSGSLRSATHQTDAAIMRRRVYDLEDGEKEATGLRSPFSVNTSKTTSMREREHQSARLNGDLTSSPIDDVRRRNSTAKSNDLWQKGLRD